MGSTITLHNLAKTYPNGQKAVRRLSMTVADGEFLVLLGPSGCGKSTLLRMIAGLETISGGELHLDGKMANDLQPSERDIAMIFQSFALYPSMTTAQNIGFPLAVQKQDHDRVNARVHSVAQTLGISHLLDQIPGRLSGGERQRVAMGRAVVRRPSVFLMDEPLSSLDARLRARLRTEMLAITRSTGATTVYVTHDQAEAMALGDRVAVMRDGVLQQIDTPRSLYALPANAFVGTPRNNLLHGTVHAPVDGVMALSSGAQKITLSYPLTHDHQMLRVVQGQPLLIGLRPEAIRIADRTHATVFERAMTGIVEHTEFQGHEALLHLSLGGQRADVPDQLADHAPHAPARRSAAAFVRRLRHRTGLLGRRLPHPGNTQPPAQPPARKDIGELVIRDSPGARHRRGQHIPLLIDVRNLLVFDERGERVSPDPTRVPDL
ncbi:ABC transporter ATP-binding protein [Streptomyces nitrosporeus]|uniref:ABC transporter ATP-binding protein n=1 Tax=Streptomyces nitrosporeus TaxID=28894 RepID=A0A5J6F735_9ACTN|nr:ABC transporter ATP-binding protein [Streptomyces nitrosporeus]QEU70650.1 ABC transporter ATP-binding protein [Streptomyces nitrosporeus]GGZ06013.1 sugar ABC transporter ATP-binding protein [Streptomyces nitrosporeus]